MKKGRKERKRETNKKKEASSYHRMKGADREEEYVLMCIYIYIYTPLLQVQGYMQRALCIWTIIFPLVDDRRFAVCTI